MRLDTIYPCSGTGPIHLTVLNAEESRLTSGKTKKSCFMTTVVDMARFLPLLESRIMDKILVWDFPSRIIHWLFAGSLSAALAIAFLVDDEQPIFKLHMVLGIVAVFSLAVRVLLGIVGSRYSRFANFPLRPREVATYFVNAVFSKTKRYAGNNPGSAIAAVLMFLIVPGCFLRAALRMTA